MTKTITLFGSNRLDPKSNHYAEVLQLGRLLAHHNYTLCNGGYAGVMEASARGAAEAGGHTIGITLKDVPASANPFIKEEIKADSLYQRLRLLLEIAHAYIVLPGGTGTLVELALCLELQIKGIMAPKPIILLGSFWKDVLNTLQKQTEFQNPFKPNNIHDFPDTTLIATYSADETIAKLNDLLSESP